MKKLMPVRLPPGRARLATRPSLTGSSPTMKTMGIVVVAALAANAAAVPPVAAITATCRRTRFGRQRRQPIDLILGPAVFDRHVLALDIAGVLEALAKSAQTVRERVRRSGVEKPDHRHRRLLRARRERPRRRRAAEQRAQAPTSSSNLKCHDCCDDAFSPGRSAVARSTARALAQVRSAHRLCRFAALARSRVRDGRGAGGSEASIRSLAIFPGFFLLVLDLFFSM